jgi:hypothetical protein
MTALSGRRGRPPWGAVAVGPSDAEQRHQVMLRLVSTPHRKSSGRGGALNLRPGDGDTSHSDARPRGTGRRDDDAGTNGSRNCDVGSAAAARKSEKASATLGIGARSRDLNSELGECRAYDHGEGRGPSSTDDHLTYASDCHSSCHSGAGTRKEELGFAVSPRNPRTM